MNYDLNRRQSGNGASDGSVIRPESCGTDSERPSGHLARVSGCTKIPEFEAANVLLILDERNLLRKTKIVSCRINVELKSTL